MPNINRDWGKCPGYQECTGSVHDVSTNGSYFRLAVSARSMSKQKSETERGPERFLCLGVNKGVN